MAPHHRTSVEHEASVFKPGCVSRRRTPQTAGGNRSHRMGIVIDLASHPAARRRRAAATTGDTARRPEPVSFFFDVISPFTYLAAERVERAFPDARWVSVCDEAGVRAPRHPGAEGRAEALGLPLVWPDVPAFDGRRARRAAAFAAEQDRAPAFVMAAARLAYAGG